jgi:hypothetical protein
MDYPHPLVRLDEQGRIDLSEAYDTGIGEWDKVSIRYGYSDFPDGTDEATALEQIITEARGRGLVFLSDQDARPAGSAHPQTHLWDNGLDAAAELNRMMEVRAAALDRFGENAIRMGMPLATMEEALVPLYLHHRYQVEAASKVLGGLYYSYAMRGDGQVPLRRVPAAEQQAALTALLGTLDPSALTLPRSVIDRIPPRPVGYPAHRELFDRYTGLVFDPVAPATVAAELTVGMMLQPERAARLVQQTALEPDLPGLDDVLTQLDHAVFDASPSNPYEAEVNRVVQDVVVRELMTLAARADMPQVRSLAELRLRGLRERLGAAGPRTPTAARAHALRLAADIGRYMDRPAAPWEPPQTPAAPPGSPIGGGH